jgi:hypothetical protein
MVVKRSRLLSHMGPLLCCPHTPALPYTLKSGVANPVLFWLFIAAEWAQVIDFIFCNIPISVSTIPTTLPVFNVQRVCCRWWILLCAHTSGKPVKDCLTGLPGHVHLAESAVFSPGLASSANIIHLAWCRGGELVYSWPGRIQLLQPTAERWARLLSHSRLQFAAAYRYETAGFCFVTAWYNSLTLGYGPWPFTLSATRCRR